MVTRRELTEVRRTGGGEEGDESADGEAGRVSRGEAGGSEGTAEDGDQCYEVSGSMVYREK